VDKADNEDRFNADVHTLHFDKRTRDEAVEFIRHYTGRVMSDDVKARDHYRLRVWTKYLEELDGRD
jgi:hypothetical protein